MGNVRRFGVAGLVCLVSLIPAVAGAAWWESKFLCNVGHHRGSDASTVELITVEAARDRDAATSEARNRDRASGYETDAIYCTEPGDWTHTCETRVERPNGRVDDGQWIGRASSVTDAKSVCERATRREYPDAVSLSCHRCRAK